jgi:hypothetical protein
VAQHDALARAVSDAPHASAAVQAAAAGLATLSPDVVNSLPVNVASMTSTAPGVLVDVVMSTAVTVNGSAAATLAAVGAVASAAGAALVQAGLPPVSTAPAAPSQVAFLPPTPPPQPPPPSTPPAPPLAPPVPPVPPPAPPAAPIATTLLSVAYDPYNLLPSASAVVTLSFTQQGTGAAYSPSGLNQPITYS